MSSRCHGFRYASAYEKYIKYTLCGERYIILRIRLAEAWWKRSLRWICSKYEQYEETKMIRKGREAEQRCAGQESIDQQPLEPNARDWVSGGPGMSPPHFRRTKTNAFYSRTHLPFAVTLQQLHPRTGRKEESIKKTCLRTEKNYPEFLGFLYASSPIACSSLSFYFKTKKSCETNDQRAVVRSLRFRVNDRGTPWLICYDTVEKKHIPWDFS